LESSELSFFVLCQCARDRLWALRVANQSARPGEVLSLHLAGWVVRLYDNRRWLLGFREWGWQNWNSGGWFFVVGLVSDLLINDFL
jgi:hypothetical protein